MRLTVEAIHEAEQRIDPNGDSVLVLRGCNIPVIENLAVTKNLFACIDLTDNDIAKIPVTPTLDRLTTLLLGNNVISTIATDAFQGVKNLKSLVLTNNKITLLSALAPIADLKHLERLSLVGNPVTNEKHYRHFVIKLLNFSRDFRFLDFVRITDKERNEAQLFFQTEEGKELWKVMVPEKTTRTVEKGAVEVHVKRGLDKDTMAKLHKALVDATDINQVNVLEIALQNNTLTPEAALLIQKM